MTGDNGHIVDGKGSQGGGVSRLTSLEEVVRWKMTSKMTPGQGIMDTVDGKGCTIRYLVDLKVGIFSSCTNMGEGERSLWHTSVCICLSVCQYLEIASQICLDEFQGPKLIFFGY